MSDLDQRAWDIYIKRNNLTINELSNPALCVEHRRTLLYASTRFYLTVIDCCEIIAEALKLDSIVKYIYYLFNKN